MGMKLSILLFVVCFSGTLATLSHEMDWLFNPAMRATPSEGYASWNKIVSNIEEAYPEGKITYWQRAEEPYMTDLIYVTQDGDLKYTFANPYTGVVQGSADLTFQRFFRDLHYYLFIPNQIGHFIVLFFGFVILVSLLTGMFYYHDWYKKLFVLKMGKGSKIFYSSLHKLVGAWSIPFMILISATGIWYFIERADVANVSASMDEERPNIPQSALAQYDTTAHIDYDRCVAIAQQTIPGLKVKGIQVPGNSRQSVYLSGTSGVPLVRDRANRVYINPYTYEVMKVQRAEELNTITWLNDIADPLHFGYWGGLTTKVIWFFFGLALSSLVLTGPWLYLKKRMRVNKLQKERRVVYG